jgi:hypothetical protein
MIQAQCAGGLTKTVGLMQTAVNQQSQKKKTLTLYQKD